MASSFVSTRPVLTRVLLVFVVLGSFAFGVTLREVGLGTQARAQTSTSSGPTTAKDVTGDAKPLWSYSDDFSYTDMSQMLAAGWTLNNVPPSYYSFGGGLVTFQNDGVNSAGGFWSHIPKHVSSWTVSASIEWVGNYVGTVQINIFTAGHYYAWAAEGYYGTYALVRESTPGVYCCDRAWYVPGYTPVLNLFHTMRIDMKNNVISLYFDGNLMTKYTEPDTSRGNTELIGIAIQGSWNTNNSYDWLQATQLPTK